MNVDAQIRRGLIAPISTVRVRGMTPWTIRQSLQSCSLDSCSRRTRGSGRTGASISSVIAQAIASARSGDPRVAREDDEVTSIATAATTETAQPAPAPGFGRKAP